MKTKKSNKNLHKKLNKIREDIDQPIIFKIGMRHKGKFDLLGIKCFEDSDDSEEEVKGRGGRKGEGRVCDKVVGYIG